MKQESEFRIVVPKFDNSGNPISDKAISQIGREMSDRFGGVTINPSVLGCWWDKDRKKLMCENNTIMSSVRDCEGLEENACRDMVQFDRGFVEELAERVGNDFGQASIMVSEDILKDAQFVESGFKQRVSPKFRRNWGETDWFEKMV